MSELALTLIRQAKEQRLTRLDLGCCGLREIPEELFELTWLEELVLSNKWIEWDNTHQIWNHLKSKNQGENNLIRDLPQGFKNLIQLRKLVAAGWCQPGWKIQDLSSLVGLANLTLLDLSANQLTKLSALSSLTNLTDLYLMHNQITDLSSLSGLINLTQLDLGANKLTDLSALSGLINLKQISLSGNQVNDVGALSGLTNLTMFYLTENQLTELCPLTGLTNLTRLDLSENQLTELRPLAGLTKLTQLDLSYNQLTELRPLAGLTKLTQLDLSYNRLTELRPLAGLTKLTQLELRDNAITDLSPLLGILNKNIRLSLESQYKKNEVAVGNNPLIHPPVEIVAQGNQAVLDYFDALAKGTAYLNEAKLIIVGEPNAGKTSLMECLWNADFELIPEADSKSTLGVDVREGWKFPHPEFKDVNFTANIWDFGGQHIQYMTHQFFLTPNAVYVLVSANDRKESTNFPYWFKIINLLGQDQGRYSPVIVVLNEKDPQFIHKFNFDRSAIERQYPYIPLKVCEVNLAKRDAKFAALQQTIQEALANLPLVKNVKPAAWQPIREALRQRAKRDAHINFTAYVRICKKHAVTEKNQQLLFLRYLHRLGSLLYFENDETLADFIILNPQWAVDAVYCVIADKTIVDSNGYFKRSQIDAIWANKKHKNGTPKYNQAEQNKLFNLMKKDNFEICYPLKDRANEFIAPQLLSAIPPNYKWDNIQNLKFRYQYEFMPQGIIARLIVRLSHLLKKQDGCDVVWQQGMLLEDTEKQCNALIQEDEVAGLKVIDIAINGNPYQRKYLLYDIRKALNDLHKRWFSNIKVEEMIPCNCRKCSNTLPNDVFYFQFSVLRGALENGLNEYPCNKSYRKVAILSLLEGIYQLEEIQFMQGKERMGNITISNITLQEKAQLIVGDGNMQKQNSDNYIHTQTLTVEQRQQLSELIKNLRAMDLSDDDMDVVDAARQMIRADEKQSTPETQGKLVKLFNHVKDWMDLSNNTIGVLGAITPALPQIIHGIQQALN